MTKTSQAVIRPASSAGSICSIPLYDPGSHSLNQSIARSPLDTDSGTGVSNSTSACRGKLHATSDFLSRRGLARIADGRWRGE